jgi:hypothetical protein
MAETAAAAPSPTPPVKPAGPERTVYGTSGLGKTLLSFLFLLLLPFFASLPMMFYMRASRGLWGDVFGLSVMAIAFTILMGLLLISLLYALRARVQLGETAVRFTLPSGRGPTPMLRYKTHEIPYRDIASVEMRREIYGGAIAPMLLQGARLTRKDGTIVKLGYVSEHNPDAALPYPEIARQIAARAGVPVIDQGSVRRTVASKMLGIVSKDASVSPIDEAEITRLNTVHRRFVLALVVGVAILLVAGIASDVINPPSSSSAVIEGVEKSKPKQR